MAMQLAELLLCPHKTVQRLCTLLLTSMFRRSLTISSTAPLQSQGGACGADSGPR